MGHTRSFVEGHLLEKISLVVKVGWIAKGLLFVFIGFLGLELGRRRYGAEDADKGGALALISDAPAGRALVLVVGAGLLLFAAWEWWSAAVDDDLELLGIVHRVGKFGVGVAYALLGVTGLEASVTGGSGQSSGGGPTSPEGLTDRLFDLPGGRVLIVVIGVGTIIVGFYQAWAGWHADFIDDIETEDIEPIFKRWLTVLGGAGTLARASMLGIVGALFIVASWRYDSTEAAGLDQSLRAIAEGPFGRGLLILASLCLAAGGVFDIVTLRRRRLD